jgi:alpha-1,2-mannosyltransferase
MTTEQQRADDSISVVGGRPLLAVLLVTVAGALAALPVVLAVPRRFLPIDLLVYQAGGLAVRLGQPLYDGNLEFGGFETLPFTYPPVAALLLLPLSFLEPWTTTVLMSLLTVAAVAVMVAVAARPLLLRVPASRRPLALAGLVAGAVLMAPVAHVLSFGQVGALVVLACLWDLACVHGRARGVLIGVATAVKLVPGLFVVHLLVTRQWRAAATAIGTTLALWAVAAVILPEDSRRYFVDRVLAEADRVTPTPELITNQSLFGLLDRWGAPAVWVPVALVVLVLGLWRAARAHRAGDQVAAAVLVGLTSLLVSPVSWVHHAVWLVPAVGVVLGDGRSRRRVVGAVVVWLVACLAPVGPVLAEQVLDGDVDPSSVMRLAMESFVVLYLALIALLPVARTPDAVPVPDPVDDRAG